jgi:hypothetical protein
MNFFIPLVAWQAFSDAEGTGNHMLMALLADNNATGYISDFLKARECLDQL